MDKYLEIIGFGSQIAGGLGLIISVASFMLITQKYSLGVGLIILLLGLFLSITLFSIKPILLGVIRIEHNTRRLVTAASAEGFLSEEMVSAYIPENDKRPETVFSKMLSNKKFWLIIIDIISLLVLAYLFFGL